jgi:hypothetical protein
MGCSSNRTTRPTPPQFRTRNDRAKTQRTRSKTYKDARKSTESDASGTTITLFFPQDLDEPPTEEVKDHAYTQGRRGQNAVVAD